MMRNMKIAVFPGSFDPITMGHVDIVYRALPLFDKIVVAIGVNDQKRTLFSLEQRRGWVEKGFENKENSEVDHFSGLMADYFREVRAHYLIRGLSSTVRFQYLKTISQVK